MKFAILAFPASNCELDAYYAITDILCEEAALVSYDSDSLIDFDAVIVPGGFSYGDYLRSGAIARFAPIIPALREFANSGKPVIGICNGFQILTEAGLLPGALQKNTVAQFICRDQQLIVTNNQSPFSNLYDEGALITLPIAHGDGNYYCDTQTLKSLEVNNQIIFRYHNNPNGSVSDIAGITNQKGNVLGMMPHPERAVEKILGSDDGRQLFTSIINFIKTGEVAFHE
ncbi:phosphoribosylformylglycinamidine synthase subunit PurQ [Weissella sagaensis]|uniref:phosphoribosylformylglycinamidine synthase subunit PurQ n=1 Tax=Weissella sagaensis TaxID=2559928 RepID=UPI00214CF85F|nr:phosphoribosylformylglycinamidine synthase subunit PurQ [Weissella sagaensis]